MSKYLRPDEFMPFAPKVAGEQVNVFHCKQGKDNDRLYIKRDYDGSVVAYCHHCGKRGIHRGTSTTPIHVLKNNCGLVDGTATQPYVPPLTMPSSGTVDWKDWPTEIVKWVRKYDITQEETRRYGIMAVNFGNTGGYIALPVYNDAGTLDHYQRRFFGKASGDRPKYDTIWRRGAEGKVYHGTQRSKGKGAEQRSLFRGWYPDPTDTLRTNTIVIVEDTLSAIRCARHCDSIALGTTHLEDSMLKQLLTEYDNFLIFLDNDNTHVNKAQLKLKRRLDMHANGVVKLIKAERDPKEHTDAELKELLCVTK